MTLLEQYKERCHCRLWSKFFMKLTVLSSQQLFEVDATITSILWSGNWGTQTSQNLLWVLPQVSVSVHCGPGRLARSSGSRLHVLLSPIAKCLPENLSLFSVCSSQESPFLYFLATMGIVLLLTFGNVISEKLETHLLKNLHFLDFF